MAAKGNTRAVRERREEGMRMFRIFGCMRPFQRALALVRNS
jgi:hypothetical protein